MNKRILLVEDDSTVASNCSEKLELKQYLVDWTDNLQEAQEYYDNQNYLCAIIDLTINNINIPHPHKDPKGGKKLVEYIKSQNPFFHCIILTADDDNIDIVKELMNEGGTAWQDKVPEFYNDLSSKIEKFANRLNSQRGLNSGLKEIYNQSFGCPKNIYANYCTREKLDYTDTNNHIFLGLPFHNYSSEDKAIRSLLDSVGVKYRRADYNSDSNILVCDICAAIRTSSFAIFDLSTKSNNVTYELGIATALCKTSLLLYNITTNENEIPSDLKLFRIQKYTDYENNTELKILSLKIKILKWLESLINNYSNAPKMEKNVILELLSTCQKEYTEENMRNKEKNII